MEERKKKGVFRKGLLGLITFVIIVLSLYITFFLDAHLKYLVKKELTKINCAEVNIKDLDLSFKNAELSIKEIELTNYNDPDFNVLEISDLSLNFSWDALLRFKYVIEKSKLKGLNFNEKRESRGQIYPHLKALVKKKVGASEKISDKKKEILEDNIFANLVNVLSNKGDYKEKLKSLNVTSLQKISSLEKEIRENAKNLKTEISKIKDFSEINNLLKKAKSIKISKNPIELLKQLKEFNQIKKEIDGKIQEKKTSIKLKTEKVKEINNKAKSIDNWVSEDIKNLKSELKIPDLKISSMAQNIFSDYIKVITAPYLNYLSQIEANVPKKKKDLSSAPKPVERFKGIDVRFETEKSYPQFLLKLLEISSESKVSKSNQDIAYSFNGEIKNVTSSFSSPAVFNLIGKIPQSRLQGININGRIEKENDKIQTFIKGKINSFKSKLIKLLNSKNAKLSLKDASSDISFEGILSSVKSDFLLKSDFSKTNWSFESDKNQKIISDLFKGLKSFDLRAKVLGPLSTPRIKISSSFDQKIKAQIKSLVGEKVSEQKDKIKKHINEKISDQKEKLVKTLGASNKDLMKPLLESENSLDSIKNVISKIADDFKQKQKSKAKNKVKEELNKLKDKFKLPF